jgi:hypothetical protein
MAANLREESDTRLNMAIINFDVTEASFKISKMSRKKYLIDRINLLPKHSIKLISC